jgi:type I restriction-modification system DNA methylase subunit
MSSTPPRIIELVETFDRNIETYHSQQYNETQLRREFIDPFFEELGWDVSNKQGYAQAYKEVIHEDAVKVGTATKAPDYSFRIGGVRKFFLEAKKPSINIGGDPQPAYQLRRYAWSAKLPVSILTDFEEFAVYDCLTRPKQTDGTSTARIMFLTYKDYINKWNEIADIFSKEAVLKGSFDKFAVSAKAKRGTTTVDKEFLAELEKWRAEFARIIALRNIALSAHEINFAVQRTIDRIIFLRMCEDRGIEPYGQLQTISNGDRTYPRLCEIFEKADHKYNSGLFYFQKERGRPENPDELTLNLVIDDAPLKYILHSLYYPLCPYEFSVLPVEILGNVYEQFLGSVIQVSRGRRTKVELKPEVKKAGGIYYTPDYIVDYIVKNTVGRLLGDPAVCHCEERSDEAISNKLKTKNSTLKTPAQVANLRILDPACGSGSFLLGAYTYLLNFHRDWYVENNPKKYTKQIYQGRGGLWFLTIAEKKKILLNNIFGVDIDSQAVEVTKLSLLLKVLEGESQETIENQMRMFRERALPDLGNNIKCGNSLIAPDFFDNPDIDSSDDELQQKINAFDWKEQFPEIFKGKTTGFDAVIGNPPYGAEFSEKMLDYLKLHFETCTWRGESYLLFVEKAISLLIQGGEFGYIIPDTYLNLGFTNVLRTLLLRQTVLREIVSLPANVFEGTTVDTTLLFTKKSKLVENYNKNDVIVKIFRKEQKINSISQPDREFKTSTSLWYEHNAFLIHSDPTQFALVSKIESSNRSLSEYAEIFYGIKVYQVGKGSPPQTEEIRDSKPFTSNKKTDDTFLPMFDGKHIDRYSLLWKRDNWVKYGSWLAEPREPEKYQGEKLLIRKIVGKTLIGTYFPTTSYCNTLVYVLKLKSNIDLSYLYFLGILNSPFIGWYFRQKFQISHTDTFPQIMIRDILQLPIPNVDKSKHDKMVKLVDRMLDLNKKLAKAKVPDEKTKLQRQISTTDHQIDNLVYELYGLTDDEITIVEGGDK